MRAEWMQDTFYTKCKKDFTETEDS